MKKVLYLFVMLLIVAVAFHCDDSDDEGDGQVEFVEGGEQEGVQDEPDKDANLQEYNLEEQKKLAKNRFPCDTLALREFILNNYPAGTYLVDFDKTSNYSSAHGAVIYLNEGGIDYILAVVVKSKTGERLVEVENVVGYYQSFIDLDSTDLGTAFFFLTLFRCDNGNFTELWEKVIPRHGGFNSISMETWKPKNLRYVRCNFHYARGVGHFDFNYFFVDGLTSEPHMLLTYEGINFKREMIDANDDLYPDYLEYAFVDTGEEIVNIYKDQYVWKDSVYVNRNDSKMRRYY